MVLQAGGLARKMGLPVKNLIVANNNNECLNRIFSKGIFSKEAIHETVSSAIDILIPLNFWRYLYFCIDKNPEKLNHWTEEFEQNGIVKFDEATFNAYKKGFLSGSVSDERTMKLIKEVFETDSYLLDPHTAVSLEVANSLRKEIGDHKVICLATAHPAKFPETIRKSLGCDILPNAATHPSIETARCQCQKGYTVDNSNLEEALIDAMKNHWVQNR